MGLAPSTPPSRITCVVAVVVMLHIVMTRSTAQAAPSTPSPVATTPPSRPYFGAQPRSTPVLQSCPRVCVRHAGPWDPRNAVATLTNAMPYDAKIVLVSHEDLDERLLRLLCELESGGWLVLSADATVRSVVWRRDLASALATASVVVDSRWDWRRTVLLWVHPRGYHVQLWGGLSTFEGQVVGLVDPLLDDEGGTLTSGFCMLRQFSALTLARHARAVSSMSGRRAGRFACASTGTAQVSMNVKVEVDGSFS